MAKEGTEEHAEAVNYKAAEDFFNGNKEDADPETTASPEGDQEGLVEVSIQGRKVKMPAEAADAYHDFVKKTRERDGRLGGELNQLRERSAKLEGMVESLKGGPREEADIKPPDPNLAREDWEEYHRQMMTYNATMMQRQQAELEGRYRQDLSQREAQESEESRQQLWAKHFYQTNPELDKPHLRSLVHAVYQEHATEINSYTDVEDQHTRLADLANKRRLAIMMDGKTTKTKTPPRVEGVSKTASPSKTTEEKEFSQTDWLYRTRARMRGEKLA